MKYRLLAPELKPLLVPYIYAAGNYTINKRAPICFCLRIENLNVRRLVATKSFHCNNVYVCNEELGGWLGYNAGLSQDDDSWVCLNSMVTGTTMISGDSYIKESHVSGASRITGSVVNNCYIYACDIADSTLDYSHTRASILTGCDLIYSWVCEESRINDSILRDCKISESRISGVRLENQVEIQETQKETRVKGRKL